MQKYAINIAFFAGCLLIVLAAQFGMVDLYVQSVIMFMGINIILSSSLNIVNGYMGEFSCGHAAFMCVGAYVSSVITVVLFAQNKIFGAPILPPDMAVFFMPLAILAGGVVAALVGILVAVPSFKTRGDYLAIITIAVNYMVISGIENLEIIGGSRGFMGMKQVVYAMGDVVDIPWMMIWTILGTVFTIWIIRRFVSSTYGKGISAICQDEIAAEIMSVNTNKMKLVAFMLSSGLAGVAGGLFAHVIGYVNPQSFNILKSTECMVMVYLGGMGSLSGSVLSAVLFTLLLEALRPLQIVKWVIIPLILVLLMQFRPEGILGNKELSDVFPRLKRYFRFK
ncbi:branched-chain amino acid ABC transporter permease [Pseudodesulfovibrio senegalensis]|uniref:Branched-chain amino acid ABC transporter permease n=1 Tax=Pseudodesulfovibrio senegalensis TaxID=1721087 RepID=A0A6N6N0J3_9BACT|nr:branched-chain amino acid ABC transporter permease [Pseudodesulfovibrio senegalensis]KAB1440898.1 branched-chain amino acid ABC transporter permease [Pseudodesulfovibrio senegalensis]